MNSLKLQFSHTCIFNYHLSNIETVHVDCVEHYEDYCAFKMAAMFRWMFRKYWLFIFEPTSGTCKLAFGLLQRVPQDGITSSTYQAIKLQGLVVKGKQIKQSYQIWPLISIIHLWLRTFPPLNIPYSLDTTVVNVFKKESRERKTCWTHKLQIFSEGRLKKCKRTAIFQVECLSKYTSSVRR